MEDLILTCHEDQSVENSVVQENGTWRTTTGFVTRFYSIVLSFTMHRGQYEEIVGGINDQE